MASTHDLASIARKAVAVGAKIVLVGDPAQLDAPEAGGFLGWLDRQGKTEHLTTLHRFENEWEKAASLQLRAGDPTPIQQPGAYAKHQRLHDGDEEMVDGAYLAVRQALSQGKTALLIAATNEHVA